MSDVHHRAGDARENKAQTRVVLGDWSRVSRSGVILDHDQLRRQHHRRMVHMVHREEQNGDRIDRQHTVERWVARHDGRAVGTI